jgi:hypothetical protein
MCLAKSAPKRQESIAQRSSLIWTFPICGPKWSKKHSPGFTLGNSPPDWALKGPQVRQIKHSLGIFRCKPDFSGIL